jgi:hypothetical protein
MYLWFAILPGNSENYRIGIPKRRFERNFFSDAKYMEEVQLRILLN